jgi:FliI/YscN family ATPase
VESRGPSVAIGDFCEIVAGERRIRTQVVGFRDGKVLAIPLEEIDGLQLGDSVIGRGEAARVPVGRGLLGRVLDGFGNPMDGGPPIDAEDAYGLYTPPPNALEREHITKPLVTGIRAIDGLLPIGLGQRIGIFGGSGVGKSTLLGAMSRQNSADVTVIGLIGERNREVRGFLEKELGPEGRARSVVVCATSEQPAPLRVRACFVALAVAEYFRDQGANVLLVMDSVTRLAMAQREIGLAAGEPPSQKGYTPSVFALLPKILERAGNFPKGSITGFFTVLVEGDDFNEPICDAVRAILDGHVILSRSLAAQGHYPAIDVLHSVSRLISAVASPGQRAAAQKIRHALSSYRDAEDLIQLGAYVSGSNPALDASIRLRPDMIAFLRQEQHEAAQMAETLVHLEDLAGRLEHGGTPATTRKR